METERIEFKFGAHIDPQELGELFAGTTWADGRTPEKIQTMIQNSPIHVSAWSGKKMVGFLRAITDDVYRAVLDDLVVHESFRKQGIGTEMMKKILERLDHLEEVSVDCASDLIPYYESLGFLRDQFACLRVWRRK